MTEPVRMVDITKKPETYREAVAEGFIRLKESTIKLIREGKVEKGNPLAIATVAATIAAKKTPELIPMAHNIPITNVRIEYEILNNGIKAKATVKTTAKTGVEMEALTAVTTALLNIWDIVKKYEKDEQGQYPTTKIENIRVTKKLKATTPTT